MLRLYFKYATLVWMHRIPFRKCNTVEILLLQGNDKNKIPHKGWGKVNKLDASSQLMSRPRKARLPRNPCIDSAPFGNVDIVLKLLSNCDTLNRTSRVVVYFLRWSSGFSDERARADQSIVFFISIFLIGLSCEKCAGRWMGPVVNFCWN